MRLNQQVDDVVATGDSQPVIERHHASSVATPESQQYRSVTCRAVSACLSSSMMAGETASGQKRCPEFVTRSWSRASAVARGARLPAGSCAQTRMTPNSVKRARCPPLGRASGDNPLPRQAHGAHGLGPGRPRGRSHRAGRPLLMKIAVQESVNVCAGEDRRVRRHAEHGNAVANVDVSVDQALEHVFDEGIDHRGLRLRFSASGTGVRIPVPVPSFAPLKRERATDGRPSFARDQHLQEIESSSAGAVHCDGRRRIE
jgi:hypothetical protein